MIFTLPIFRLKRIAKQLSRKKGIPLHKALDAIAQQQGVQSWSLLAERHAHDKQYMSLMSEFHEGDLILLGGRPGHGKTQLSLRFLLEAAVTKRPGFFFTLEYTQDDLVDVLESMNLRPSDLGENFTFHGSDEISADYIERSLASVKRGSLVIVDYLQLLDQRRINSELADQLKSLKRFARTNGITFIMLSQIDRFADRSNDRIPSISDVRLPNPLDLSVFDRFCFLSNGKAKLI